MGLGGIVLLLECVLADLRLRGGNARVKNTHAFQPFGGGGVGVGGEGRGFSERWFEIAHRGRTIDEHSDRTRCSEDSTVVFLIYFTRRYTARYFFRRGVSLTLGIVGGGGGRGRTRKYSKANLRYIQS